MPASKCGQVCVQQGSIDNTLAVVMNGMCLEMPMPMHTPIEHESSGWTRIEVRKQCGHDLCQHSQGLHVSCMQHEICKLTSSQYRKKLTSESESVLRYLLKKLLLLFNSTFSSAVFVMLPL